MSEKAVVALRRPSPSRSGWDRWLPPPVRAISREIEERNARIPTRLNAYGYDPCGFDPEYARPLLTTMALIYRHWLRVEATGVGNVPEGRVLLIANHAGNTFAWDGTMLGMSLFLEGTPPRIVRGMGEYYLPTIPFFSVFMHRVGSVVGTPANCAHLLGHEEAIMVFPEGERGFVKTFRQRYQLQRFGLGFMRLALETDTPIVPIGIVGAEEQSPGIANLRSVGRLLGSPAFPVTLTFPWLGLASFLPLPVKFRIRFGEPMRFTGDPSEEDASVEKKVEQVKQRIRALIDEGRRERRNWFV